MELIFIWLILAVVLAIVADSRGRSALGFFLLSVLLSPVIALIVLLVGPNKKTEAAEEQRRREDHERQLESIKALHRGGSGIGSTTSVADELTKLAALREKGLLTDSEFNTQKAALLSARSSL
jgi:hypothetical protein